jgi:two-component system CitB family sensor kinase
VVVPGWALAVHAAQESARTEAVERAHATVVTLMLDPSVLAAVTGPDPAGALAIPIERVRAADNISFLVVMSPGGTRYTHPDPAKVGQAFQGTIAGAQRGETTVEDFTGTLGRSVRVVAPLRNRDGVIVALVAAGVPLTSIADQVRASSIHLGLLTAGSLALGALGAALLARRLHRQTYGLGPVGLARLHSYHDSLLHSVGAGLVLVGNDGTVVLCNDEARRLLDTPLIAPGAHVAAVGLDVGLGELMSSGRDCSGEVYATAARTLVVTQVPAVHDGRGLGWVTTLRDRTDLVRLTGELDSLRTFTESLSARAHEADNRLHTVVMLVEIGQYEQAVAFATTTIAQTRALMDTVTSAVMEPPLAALLLGKAAQAEERGVRLEFAPDTLIPATGLAAGDLVMIVGNLVDNAIDAAADAPLPRFVRIGGGQIAGKLVIEVADSGPGLTAELVSDAFTRGWTTKSVPEGDDRLQGRGLGLALVQGTVRRLGGTIEVRWDRGSRFVVRLPVPAMGSLADPTTNPTQEAS